MESQHEAPTEPIVADKNVSSVKSRKPSPQVKPRRGNPVISFLLFVLGIMLGILATLLFVVFGAHDNTPLPSVASPQNMSLTVQVESTYLTQLVSRELTTAGLPGDISNVHVTLTGDDRVVVQGDDTFNLFVTSVTQPFTVTLQPTIQACQPHVHVLHADLGTIPVTTFATNYESLINQKIQQKGSNLPSGFTYCAVGVRTAPEALYFTYLATPMS